MGRERGRAGRKGESEIGWSRNRVFRCLGKAATRRAPPSPHPEAETRVAQQEATRLHPGAQGRGGVCVLWGVMIAKQTSRNANKPSLFPPHFFLPLPPLAPPSTMYVTWHLPQYRRSKCLAMNVAGPHAVHAWRRRSTLPESSTL